MTLLRNPALLFAVALVGTGLTTLVFTRGGGPREAASHADPAANYAGYRTFALLPTREPLSPRATPEVLHAIDDGVREVLGERGLRTAEVAAADLLVLVHGGPRELVEPTEAGFSYGRFRPWGYGGGALELNAPRTGLVLIDVFDARTRELVWRGAAPAPEEPGPLHASLRAAAAQFPR